MSIDPAMARRVGMYLCRLCSGLKLREIGAAYGVGESAVAQASRRVAGEMKNSKSARESIGLLERDLRASKVQVCPPSFRRAQAMPKHHEQQATGTGFKAAALGGGDELFNFARVICFRSLTKQSPKHEVVAGRFGDFSCRCVKSR